MEFRIADTFTDSLARLPGQEQKAVKTTAFDLQVNPAQPGLQLHRIERAKDPDFWSVRVNRDIRLIVHRTVQSMLLCYVDHHDRAYAWAERRRIERHPRTGAAQLVEIRERVEEVPVHAEVPAVEAKPRLFANHSDDVLLSSGLPQGWLDAVRQVDEDGLFELAEHLPQEAAEALLDLAVGATPKAAEVFAAHEDAFAHPDAQRRFRVMANVDELRQALEYPWERWTIFLHPAQRELVERRFGGPARVAGSAGTGKTVVALHRAAYLARLDPTARVLVTTFSRRLALALEIKLKRLLDQNPAALARVTVAHVDGIGYRLHELFFRTKPNVASAAQVESALGAAAKELGEERFSRRFLLAEWQTVVDAWQLKSWETYRDVSRLGRRTRIGGKQREALWAVFERARARLHESRVMTWAEIVGRVSDHVAARNDKPFTHAVADEAQDLSVPQLRMLKALAPEEPDVLFFAGDLGQRIFQHPFSWLSLGIDVRGRSFSLKVNYRTSHQIRRRADVLLPRQIRDVDGYEDSRAGTISVFDGPEPIVRSFAGEQEEIAFVGDWLRSVVEGGARPEEIGVFVRVEEQLSRARRAVKAAGQEALTLTDKPQEEGGCVLIGTMHLAKGLEFKAVAVMACDDDVLPLQSRIEHASDESELDEVYDTERHLLYVAVTRARDQALVTGLAPAVPRRYEGGRTEVVQGQQRGAEAMAEADRTDQEIDDVIREWRIRLRDMPEALGVSWERVFERWEWFRQEVYRRIAEGKSTPEIVAEVGLPSRAVAAFRAHWTRGYRPDRVLPPEPGSDAEDALDSADVENAVVTTFGLERDLQRTLRENIAQLEPGLRIIDGGNERRSAAGLIDPLFPGCHSLQLILCANSGIIIISIDADEWARDGGRDG